MLTAAAAAAAETDKMVAENVIYRRKKKEYVEQETFDLTQNTDGSVLSAIASVLLQQMLPRTCENCNIQQGS